MTSQPQNIIAIMSDFDRTLSPSCLTPVFESVGMGEEEFFKIASNRYDFDRNEFLEKAETEEYQLPEYLRVDPRLQERFQPSPEFAYMNVFLDLMRKDDRFRGITRRRLRELGRDVNFYSGVPSFVPEMKDAVATNKEWLKYGVKLEFYVVSSGLAEVIRGTKISPYCDGIFGLEVCADVPDSMDTPICEVVSPMTFTDKTGVVHRIHKGPSSHVNDFVPPQLRRVAGNCMIYMGDGATDIPPMSATNGLGGKSLAIYTDNFETAYRLRDQGRVFAYGPANFEKETVTRNTLEMMVTQTAEGIIYRNERMLREGTSPAVKF